MSRTATLPRKKSIYGVHPGVLMTQKWIGELKQKTGRTLEEWLAHIRKAGPKGETERRAWLKETHGLGTNTASWLAERGWVYRRAGGLPLRPTSAIRRPTALTLLRAAIW